MTLYLRSKDNNTIVDIELFVNNEGIPFVELRSVVDIQQYSKLLLENLDKKYHIIEDFSYLAELRGWLWEYYFLAKRNTADDYEDVLKEVKSILTEIANRYNLFVVED